MKPILKWAGGKRQLMNEIKKRIPENFNNYFEPFVGGGSVFISLGFENSVVNDINSGLINMYKVIKDKPNELIALLKTYTNTEDDYYKIRNIDRNEKEFNALTDVQKAARFIFLNRTCFNGLYRENSKGQFNTPFGKYKNPTICDEENILQLSDFFNKKNIEFNNRNYSEIIDMVQKDDFIYLDPPYDILNDSTFTKYNKNDFNREDQTQLKLKLDEVNARGGKFMMSNADTDFIKDLYKDYKIEIVKANRNINSNGAKRDKVNEVIITNY